MTYKETIEYLYARLPMFQKIGGAAYNPGLENIEKLCRSLNNPEKKFPSVHIAGTNGKGSTSHTIAAILQTAGYKTGLYTSPHLKSFTERIKINGQTIEEQFIIDFVKFIQPKIDEINPSFFEITVAMAFAYFAENQVDIAVIEVGMGGRLDSTNVIKPLVSVITNISFDHTEFLGDTLPKIAGEKAGIIKKQVPVVISEFHPETAPVFREKARLENAPIFFAQEEYEVNFETEKKDSLTIIKKENSQKTTLFDSITPSLKGTYQLKNLIGILKTIEILQNQGKRICSENIQKGIEQAAQLTGLKGRWQIIQEKPLTICDTAHNEGGIREVIAQVLQTPHHRLHFILGFAKEKDLQKILPLYPANAFFYFCSFQLPRALPAKILAETAQEFGIIGHYFDNVNLALAEARQQADSNDLILIGGSTFVVAEVDEI
jgi:dihydrofolate synthase/folylpolyglutamate synthase